MTTSSADYVGSMCGLLLFSLVPLLVGHCKQRRELQRVSERVSEGVSVGGGEGVSERGSGAAPPPGPSRRITRPPLTHPPSTNTNTNTNTTLHPHSHTRQLSLDSGVEQTEILLHNISHADMIMSLDEDATILARPKFSCFRRLSEIMYHSIKEMSGLSLVEYPVHTREHTLAKRPIRKKSSDCVPVGFDFKELCQTDLLSLPNTDQLRFRHKDKDLLPPGEVKIAAAFFPLLAALIPQWQSYIHENGKVCRNRKFVVFLISGQGTPRDETASVVDNSTDICAELMKIFLQQAYPEIEVVLVPSPSLNLFRYDENIQFVKQILLPRVEKIRNSVVDRVQEHWKEYMHLYISYASGSSARVSAIGASLRPYR
jgi:hypothetical protein